LFTARVLPGDQVTWTVRAKASWSSDPLVPQVLSYVDLYATLWQESLFKYSNVEINEFHPGGVPTNYTTITQTFTVPETSLAEGENLYLGLSVFPYVDGPPLYFQKSTCVFDIDNCSLSIQPGPGNAAKAEGYLRSPLDGIRGIEPNYDIDVRFEGQTLKSYAAVHHVDKKTAPTHVVLS
jgi:hypothetical protein